MLFNSFHTMRCAVFSKLNLSSNPSWVFCLTDSTCQRRKLKTLIVYLRNQFLSYEIVIEDFLFKYGPILENCTDR